MAFDFENKKEKLSPFPYQKIGAEWLTLHPQRLLADEMGLGKTAQAILAADQVGAQRILVICPAVAKINWLREFEMWSPRTRDFYIAQKTTELPRPDQSIICSFDYASENFQKISGRFDLMIVDEAHFLKSTEAKRALAIMGRDGLIHKSKRFWALTGTPAPNHAGELWVILRTFGATDLSYDQFVTKFCNLAPGHRGAYRIVGTKMHMIPELKKILEPIILRRKKEDVLTELPAINFGHITVEPGPVDLDACVSFVKYVFPDDRSHELFERLDKERALLESAVEAITNRGDKLKALEAMAESVSTLRRYIGVQKIQPVAELVKKELEEKQYEKIVIFAIHQEVIEGLRAKLAKLGAVTLYGGTPPEKRQKHVDNFQKDPKTRIFIGNIQAAGTAITLTAAHHVLFVEQDWVPGNNAQAAMRVHRIGQKNPVFVRFVAIDGSIDARVVLALKKKIRELTAIFD